MSYLSIAIILAIIITAMLVFAVKTSEEQPEEPKIPKFQPRQVTIIGKEVYTSGIDPIEVVKPKRKYKKRKSKKKPVVESEKRPVGRPRISK